MDALKRIDWGNYPGKCFLSSRDFVVRSLRNSWGWLVARLNAFEEKEKKRRLKINPILALIGLRRTGPRKLARLFLLKKIKKSPFPIVVAFVRPPQTLELGN